MRHLLKLMLHNSFEFDATTYEIYENGRCIKRAKCDTLVVVKYSLYDGVMFTMHNNPTYIYNEFSFVAAPDDLLNDRVQYGRLRPIDYVSGDVSRPIACNIFPQNGVLRLVTPNPLRLIEFSGHYRVDY